MTGAYLYPNIEYFTLTKEMPGCPIGSVVGINDADGRENLYILNPEHASPLTIEMHIETAIKYPDWFKPITKEEHIAICKENSILWLMNEKGKTREEAEQFEAKHG